MSLATRHLAGELIALTDRTTNSWGDMIDPTERNVSDLLDVFYAGCSRSTLRQRPTSLTGLIFMPDQPK